MLRHRRLRAAVLIGALGFWFEYASFLLHGFERQIFVGEYGAHFSLFAFGIAVLLTGGTYLVWRFGPPLIDGVSHLLRYLFARRTSVKTWDDATDRAFVALPYAAGGAAAAWIIFAATGYGGWPKHFILCCFWNAFAAWFYLTLLYRWRQAVRNSRDNSP